MLLAPTSISQSIHFIQLLEEEKKRISAWLILRLRHLAHNATTRYIVASRHFQIEGLADCGGAMPRLSRSSLLLGGIKAPERAESEEHQWLEAEERRRVALRERERVRELKRVAGRAPCGPSRTFVSEATRESLQPRRDGESSRVSVSRGLVRRY